MADAMSDAGTTVSAQQTPFHSPLGESAKSELYISDKSVKCAFPSGSCEEDQEYVLQWYGAIQHYIRLFTAHLKRWVPLLLCAASVAMKGTESL